MKRKKREEEEKNRAKQVYNLVKQVDIPVKQTT